MPPASSRWTTSSSSARARSYVGEASCAGGASCEPDTDTSWALTGGVDRADRRYRPFLPADRQQGEPGRPSPRSGIDGVRAVSERVERELVPAPTR